MKICENCGRQIEPRKKWNKNWEQVKYCSDKCRRKKSSPDFQSQILELLHLRGAGKTICPSEILSDSEKKNKHRMEEVRASARLLVAQGKIQITQKGQVVDPSFVKGPIRLKLVRKD